MTYLLENPLPGKSDQSTQEKAYPAKLRTNRIFILDTNVLIYDPNSIFAFKDVVVGIPFIVLEELDTFKKEPGEKGHNVRQVIRSLDALRKKGHLGDGVPLENDTGGSILKVYRNPERIDFSMLHVDIHDVKDNIIIQTAANLAKDGNQVTLITKDINVRIKSDSVGLDTEDYTKGAVSTDLFYKGWMRIPVPANDLRLMTAKRIESVIANDTKLYPNQFIIAESSNNPQNNRLFRYLGGSAFKEVEPMTLLNTFKAKNIQQLMALDLLMDDRIKLLTLLGPAGTGKTFLTLLAGLYQTAYERKYRKLLITRPIVALGADIGYLPGDIQEKLHYWMQPVHDNLEFISSQMLRGTEDSLHLERSKDKKPKKNHDHQNHDHNQRNGNGNGNGNGHGSQTSHYTENYLVDKLQKQGILSLEAITYMRGRSIPFQFVFIDEVQNLTPHEVKTIVSRAGEGTKVILAGDPFQIDSPYLDFTSNGLTVTTEKFKDHSLFGTVFLEISERSELAKVAAEIL